MFPLKLFIPFFIVVTTLCTPYDDARGQLADLLKSAKSECLVAVYTITSPLLVNELIDLKHQGVDVEVITDSTQARGTYESRALVALRQAGIPVFAGRSAGDQIMHTKFCVIDNSVVAFGSFNWTESAQRQDNTLTIDNSPVLVQQLHSYWLRIKEDLR